MGSYIEENLARDESIIIKAQVTWLSQFWYLFFGILLILSGIGQKGGFWSNSSGLDSHCDCSNSCADHRIGIN